MESSSSGAAAAFELVWSALVDMLGSAATASLVRKAARRGAAEYPELEGLVVKLVGLDYSYDLPQVWARAARPPALVHLVRRELLPLLRVLTGDIVVRRLERLPGFGITYPSSTEVEHA